MRHDQEQALLSALVSGEADACPAAFEAMQRELYWTALSILGNREDAADATQEALTQIWRYAARLREPDLFAVWRKRITVNACRRLMKTRGRSVAIDPQERILEGRVEGAFDEIEGQEVLSALVASLKPYEREVVVLRFMHDMSLADIGDALDLPVGTVKSRLSRALSSLRQSAPDATKEGGADG